jgi:hypothetical protein
MSRSALLLVVAVIVAACSSLPTPSTALQTARASDRADASATFAEAATSLDPALGWHRVDLGDETPGRFSAVIAAGTTFMAAGGSGSTTVPDSPVVLRSTDGKAWTAERIASSFAAPISLTAIDGRVIAVGAGGTARCAHPYAVDTWARDNAGNWSEAPWVDQLCSGLESASVIGWDGAAYLLGVGSGDVPRSWRSADGLTWNDLRPNFNGLYPGASLLDGDTVAVFGSTNEGKPAERRSTDGINFVAAPFPIFGQAVSVIDAKQVDGSPIVFVSDGAALGAVRRDASGEWTVTSASGIRADEITQILAIGSRFVALGARANGHAEAWSSPDGVTWGRVQVPAEDGPGLGLAGVALIGGTAVLVGTVETRPGTVGAIWFGSADLLAP